MNLRRRFVVATTAAVLLCSGLSLSACTTPKDALGTSVSRCFRSLEPARDVVGQDARLIGVKLTNGQGFTRALAKSRQSLVLPKSVRRSSELCVVGYLGRFQRARLDDGSTLGSERGHLVVVVVGAKDNLVKTIIVLTRSPFGFSQTFAFAH